MKFILLGSSSVRPSIKHAGPAQLLLVDKDALLFDCGRGVTSRIMEAGLSPTDIQHVFFTHHHFDHNSEFPYFLLATWVMGRKKPLRIFGPEGTRKLHDLILDEIYADDIHSRLTLPGRTTDSLRAEIAEVSSQDVIINTGPWLVKAAFTEHIPPYIKSLAYRVESQGKSVVVAGDNMPSDSIVKLSDGADLLIHECTSTQEELTARGFSTWHTSPEQLGKIASAAGVKKVVMKHFTHTVIDDESMLQSMAKQVKQAFRGEVVIGRDLLSIDI